jgi:hypothetical protein
MPATMMHPACSAAPDLTHVGLLPLSGLPTAHSQPAKAASVMEFMLRKSQDAGNDGLEPGAEAAAVERVLPDSDSYDLLLRR